MNDECSAKASFVSCTYGLDTIIVFICYVLMLFCSDFAFYEMEKGVQKDEIQPTMPMLNKSQIRKSSLPII